MSAANEAIPYYEPGERITAKATEAILGKHLVKISGNRTSGPALATTAEGGVYQVSYPTAKQRIFGVASHDVANGGLVTILRGPGMVVPIVNTGGVSAFAEVQAKADGTVETLSDGVAIGYALTGAAGGADTEVCLYH